MNPAIWVERNGRLHPDRAAVADGDRVHATWSAFGDTVTRVASGFRDRLDLPAGSRVAVLMRNRPEYLEAVYGAWHLGERDLRIPR